MNLSTAAKHGLSNYATFTGRASRSEYWYFVLFGFCVSFVAGFLDAILEPPSSIGILYIISALGLCIPNIAISVRRLHDLDKSGATFWLILIPIVGGLLLLVWFVQRGTEGENRYGHDPLDGAALASPAGHTATFGDLDRLERLSELLAKGTLTQAEYDAQKARILGSSNRAGI